MRDDRYPAPASLSPEARRVLDGLYVPPIEIPGLDDLDGWRRHVADMDAMTLEWLSASDGLATPAAAQEVAGVPCYAAAPRDRVAGDDAVVLDIHGGALFYMGGPLVARTAPTVADRLGLDVVSVDYRMPPDHPFPAGLDDCVAVYRALLERVGPARLIVHGLSAGGNLAAALMLRARDLGLPLPAALFLLTPEVDLTETGDSFATLLGLDALIPLPTHNRLYAGDAALDDPLLSPLFGDLSGFPPTFLQSGTRDLFLSNAVRMHRALREAGVDAELHVWDAMPHGGFPGTPEDLELAREMRRFVARRLAAA